MENITDYSCRLDLTTYLLETTSCCQLTSIDVSFKKRNETNETTENKVKVLIAAIHNAPSFKKMVLRCVPISFVDMENSHRDTPKLKNVKLDDAIIYHGMQ